MVERDHRRRTGRRLVSTGAVAFALLLASLVPGAPAGAALPGVATSRIRPPVSHGTLRIAGDLADGGVVEAKGLSWAPPHLPSGDRLLSLQVAYDWQACAPQGGHCVTASDTTATPFAASSYIVGHADVGMRLKLTETATEVVETDPATFSFRVVRASVTAMSAASVRRFTGRAPTTEFVNGTPEDSTASTEEYFQVDPPHFDAADGKPHLSSRIDGGPWKSVSSTYRFYTGTLDVGPHHVRVRTSNAAGATTTSFHWQVVPMPAPEPCVAPASGACWYPPHLDSTGHPMRWDWQIGRVTPLERTGSGAVDIYDVDGFLTTAAADGPDPHDVAGGDPPPPEGHLLPRPGVGGLPARRHRDAVRRRLPGRDARERLLRVPAGAMGRPAPARRPQADDRRPHRHVRAQGVRRRRAGRHRQLRARVDDRVQPHARRRAELPGVARQRDPPRGWPSSGRTPACSAGGVATTATARSWRSATSTASASPRRSREERTSASRAPRSPVPRRADGTTSPPTSPRLRPPGSGWARPSTAPTTTCATPGRRARTRSRTPRTASWSTRRSYGFAAVKFDVNLDGKTFFPCPNGV